MPGVAPVTKASWQVDSAVFCLRASREQRAASWGLNSAGLGSSRCLGNGSLLVIVEQWQLKVPLCSLVFISFYLRVCPCVFMGLCECMGTCVYGYYWRWGLLGLELQVLGLPNVGAEHQSSGWAANTFNCWSISPTAACSLFSMCVIQGLLKGVVQSRDPFCPGLWVGVYATNDCTAHGITPRQLGMAAASSDQWILPWSLLPWSNGRTTPNPNLMNPRCQGSGLV